MSRPQTLPESSLAAPRADGALCSTAWRAVGGGILVATDGLPAADGALSLANALAERDALSGELLTVYEPLPVYDTDGMVTLAMSGLDESMMDELHGAAAAQRQRLGMQSRWPLNVVVGRPAQTIARRAEEQGDQLIVVGLTTHAAMDRLLGRETALQVIRMATRPVLAVAPGTTALPRRAMVAIDFSPSSLPTARAAVRLLGQSGVLHLVHVAPRIPLPFGGSHACDHPYTDRVFGQFGPLLRDLLNPPGIRVEWVTLYGNPAKELLAFAEDNAIELIAAGTHGRNAIGRGILGSVSTKLVRGASCSVLVTPPPTSRAPSLPMP